MPTLTLQQAFDLAFAHHQAGRLAEAEPIYRQILAADPRHADALHLLGVIAQQVGRNEVAVDLIRQSMRLAPGLAVAHYNLGNALRELGRLAEAAAEFRQAIQLTPDYADAHNNLGNVLKDQGRVDEAVAAYRRALQLKPDYAEAWGNLGVALADQGHLDEAIATYQHALRLKPDHAESHYNLGNVLRDQGRLELAISGYRRTLELRPGFSKARNNLGNALKDQGRVDEALAAYREAARCDPGDPHSHSNLLLCLNYRADPDCDAMLAEHRRWEEIHARPLARFIGPHGNDPAPGRRLKIGYVSPDFREHSVACFVAGLLAAHDPAQVETFCYDDVLREDAITAQLQRHPAHWRKIRGMNDVQLAELIRGDAIDILVDLSGHTSSHRLRVFARQPAPVQVSWLGYCNTTGMRAIDYRLTDAHADPPGTTEHLHTEQLVRLPGCTWCFRPCELAPPVSAPPFESSGRVTFGCFNALPKITDVMMGQWSKILDAVPGSRLLLKNPSLLDSGARQRTRAALERAGIASERIELIEPTVTVPEHLAAYSRVDIALDTFPYHGTATTCDALWMGVPVVTLAGRVHASRVGASLLANAGLPELIARQPEEYVRIAAALGSDPARLTELRRTLRERVAASPLMDAPRFARNVEAAYREMWRAWCAGRSTAGAQ